MDITETPSESESVALARIEQEREIHEISQATLAARSQARVKGAIALGILSVIAVALICMTVLTADGKEAPEAFGTLLPLLAGGVTTMLGMSIATGQPTKKG
jgi:hypothetical protein